MGVPPFTGADIRRALDACMGGRRACLDRELTPTREKQRTRSEVSLNGFVAVGRRLLDGLRCGTAVLLDSVSIECDLGSMSGSFLQFPGLPVVGESQSMG